MSPDVKTKGSDASRGHNILAAVALRTNAGSSWRIFGVCTMHWNVLALKVLLFRTPHQVSVHLLENSTLVGVIHTSLMSESMH